MRKIFSWIRRLFPKSDTPPPEAEATATGNATNNNPYQTEVITGIEWVDNDGLLRDEGVLFGIADAGPALKIDSIKSSFDKAKSSFVITRDQLRESIASITKEQDKCLDSIAENQKELETIRLNPVKGTHNLLPGLFQLLIYAAICIFNYYLLVFWLTPVFPERSFIPLGVYLFGALSVFMGKALLYNSGNSAEAGREKWKAVLEEMGIPFIVSAFICVLSFRYYPVEWSIVAFIFFFFLFAFSGKGLVNIIHINYNYLKLQLKHRKMIRSKKKEIKKQLNILSELEKKSEMIVNDLKAPETKIAELDALFAYKVKVFESEYNLAREGRSDFSAKQFNSFNQPV